MRAVGLKVLKNKLSEYVRLAAQGRGALLADAMLADACRKGLITPAANPSEAIPPSDRVMTFEDLMRDLEEGRQDR